MADGPHPASRRTHVALAALYACAVVLVEVALFLRVTHLALLLLLHSGFTYGVMGGLVVMLIYGVAAADAPGGAFYVNPWAARVVLWMAVLGVAATFFNAVRLAVLLAGASTDLTGELFANVSAAQPVSQAGLEALLRHHMHHDEWLVLLFVLAFMGVLVVLHAATIVYCARASFPRLALSRAASFVPYNHSAASVALDSVQLDAGLGPQAPATAGPGRASAPAATTWSSSSSTGRAPSSRPHATAHNGRGRPSAPGARYYQPH